MNFSAVFSNQVLVSALVAWSIAQIIKPPLEYLRNRDWNWVILFSTGGMPSSHTALITATAHGIGLYQGFDSPLFAVAAVLAIIVIYDATGIRRQAGRHAELINRIINDLTSGHPVQEEQGEQLKEVLGHTPWEALGGMVLGLTISTLMWFWWR